MAFHIHAARLRLYHLLFDQNRRSGRYFEGFCGLFALLSVLVIFIESGLGTQYHLTVDEWHVFVWLELIVTAVFTCEYILRIISWPNPLKYIFSFWVLLTWPPFYRFTLCGCGPRSVLSTCLPGGPCALFARCVSLSCCALCRR